MKQFFFASTFTGNKAFNITWLLFRFYTGITIAIGAGWPKMNQIMAPGWFVEQVSKLGFTFPSPHFWAAAAAWGEFVGGLCIAIGFFTRFSAIQLAFQFFVVSFIWYDEPLPMFGMYYQQLLFWGFVLIAVAGSGKYSVDTWVMNRKRGVSVPLVKPALATLFLLIGISCSAQKQPLKGSGKTVTQTFSFSSFDKVDLVDLDGTIEVEVGKPFSIAVTIDDNLQPLLGVSENNGTLTVELKGNRENQLYIEETNIRIKISMPEVSVMFHRGNSSLMVTGIVGRYFRLKNTGNGSAVLQGSIDELEIIGRSNGEVRAEKLIAKNVTVTKSGNANVHINTEYSFSAKGTGNGNVVNTGKGSAGAGSGIDGNGKIKTQEQTKEQPENQLNNERQHTIIKNNSHTLVELSVKYPVRGSYGIDVPSQQEVKEYFPLGTKIYRGNQFTLFKKPLFVITKQNQNSVLVIQ
jgi:uncharacterized membrane protein YphA (DoxX/SURF4 family)